MQLKPHQLTAHLSKSLAPIYLVAGEEPLLIQESLDAIRAVARARGYSEREVLDVERGFNWQQLADSCASMSLFASRRIVEVRLAAGPDVSGAKMLQEIAERPAEDVLLLVVCGPLETRARSAAWFKALETVGASLYFWPVKGADIVPWIETRLSTAGVKADADAIKLLAERTEGNLLAAAQDVAKLALLFPGQTVSADDVTQAVADNARFQAFDLSDRVLAGDAAGAVRSLDRMREEGLSPLEILGALMWSLRQLIKATVAYARTRDAASACAAAGIYSSQQQKFLHAVPRSKPGEAMLWLRRAARIDRLVKTGQESAAWEELITLILAASGAALHQTQ
ncbi:MAG: DNA polymerase III subunit delta [Pseudomonadota bacterium]|nr:DNA polymerase III subunit delta [Pseudomonadota bacterium]